MSLRSFLLLSAVCAFFAPSARAEVVYDELLNGELSGESGSPTDLTLFMPGVNRVTGQVTSIGEGGFDGTADVFTFAIAPGEQLDTIVMTSFSTASGGGVFVALDDGPTFEYTAEQINDEFLLPDLTQILGGTVAGTADVGMDILDNLQNAVNLGNGSAFDVPLGEGQYSFYIQETGPESNYSLAFNVSSVSAVPEPSIPAALAVSGIGFAAIRWRRKRRAQAATKSSTPAQ